MIDTQLFGWWPDVTLTMNGGNNFCECVWRHGSSGIKHGIQLIIITQWMLPLQI